MSQSEYKRPTDYFDEELACMLGQKICRFYPGFEEKPFVEAVRSGCRDRALKERVELIADQLERHLPDNFEKNSELLMNILGPENEHETGMFKEFYWVMPIAKYVEKYGLDHFESSMSAIEEITKRNTGEYAIRPFIRKYPKRTVHQMKKWASSENFHLRRLASEGLRPKLPWASKLDLFIDDPAPVFEILELLKEDPVHFVRKSVANHLTDYRKVNPEMADQLISDWNRSDHEHTKWIIRHATR